MKKLSAVLIGAAMAACVSTGFAATSACDNGIVDHFTIINKTSLGAQQDAKSPIVNPSASSIGGSTSIPSGLGPNTAVQIDICNNALSGDAPNITVLYNFSNGTSCLVSAIAIAPFEKGQFDLNGASCIGGGIKAQMSKKIVTFSAQ